MVTRINRIELSDSDIRKLLNDYLNELGVPNGSTANYVVIVDGLRVRDFKLSLDVSWEIPEFVENDKESKQEVLMEDE